MIRYLLPLLLLLGGCAGDPVQEFYQLPPAAAAQAQPGQGTAVLLGPLQLADYLQRENIVQRHSEQRLHLSANQRWAGSLQDDIGRLLLSTLGNRLHSGNLALYPDRIGFAAQAQIILHIARLDSGPQQPAVLEARWRLLDAQGVQRAEQLTQLRENHDGSLDSQVAAQGRLVERLGRQLAEAVQALPTGN